MKIALFVLAALPAMAHAQVSYTTSTDAVFIQVPSPGGGGMAWKDPLGKIWSARQGIASNEASEPDKELAVIGSSGIYIQLVNNCYVI